MPEPDESDSPDGSGADTTHSERRSTSGQTGLSDHEPPSAASRTSAATDSDGISIKERIQSDSTGDIFAEKDLVRSDTIIDEDRIVGRDEQLARVVDNLSPVLDDEGIPNMLLTGPSGTGKSLILGAVCNQILELCESHGKDFGVIKLNCESVRTADQAAYKLVDRAARNAGVETGIAEHGIATDHKYERLYEILRNHYDSVVFALDEIDMLDGPYSEPEYNSLVYQLSRIRDLAGFDGPVSLTVITNYAEFMTDLNSRAQSSFNPDEIFFNDYDANQLRGILEKRRDAFKPGALEKDVIPLVAAFGSQTHGDARKAIDLLRSAGELARRNGLAAVSEEEVREAHERYMQNRVLRHIKGESTQKKFGVYAVAATLQYDEQSSEWVPSGPAYSVYQYLTDVLDADQYSRETFVNHVTEQRTYGVLDFERRGRGRGRGVHMYFSLSQDPQMVLDGISEDPRFEDLPDNQEKIRTIVRTQLQEFR